MPSFFILDFNVDGGTFSTLVVPHPDAGFYAGKFIGKYAHKLFKGIGHNPPQEAPKAFAEAVIEVDNAS